MGSWPKRLKICGVVSNQRCLLEEDPFEQARRLEAKLEKGGKCTLRRKRRSQKNLTSADQSLVPNDVLVERKPPDSAPGRQLRYKARGCKLVKTILLKLDRQINERKAAYYQANGPWSIAHDGATTKARTAW